MEIIKIEIIQIFKFPISMTPDALALIAQLTGSLKRNWTEKKQNKNSTPKSEISIFIYIVIATS